SLGQGSGSARQQGIVISLQVNDGLPGGGQVGNIEQGIQAVSTGQPLGGRPLALGLLFQGFEQAEQLLLRLKLPIQLRQASKQFGLLLIQQETVGEAEVQRIATIQLGAAQAQEQ